MSENFEKIPRFASEWQVYGYICFMVKKVWPLESGAIPSSPWSSFHLTRCHS